jgi:hypothetical protein
MRTHTLTLLIVLALVPTAGWAQSPEEQIETALSQALEVGIPVSLLESKIAEGKAKGIPMDRIAMAVEQRLEGLTRAQEVMGLGADDLDAAQISVGADALGSGVSEAVLAEIAGTTPPDQRAVAVAALTHLVGQGIVPEAALLRVQGALAQGPEGLANIPGFAGPPAGLPIPEGAGPGGGPQGGGGQVGPPSSVPAPGQGGPPDVPGSQRPPDVPAPR